MESYTILLILDATLFMSELSKLLQHLLLDIILYTYNILKVVKVKHLKHALHNFHLSYIKTGTAMLY